MADQLLSTVTHHGSLPETYVRPESQRPRLNEVLRDADVPTIDLGSPDLSRTVAQVAEACSTYGFFQIVNHGVPIELMLKMMAVASEFFRLPFEEKAKLYSDDPAKKMRLSTSFNIRKEKVRNWRDYLRLHCYPLEEFVPGWPSNPSSFKEVVSSYCREALSNGRYRSVWHRAVVNADRERMSVASFLCPCNSAVISPPEKLVADGSPAMYRSYTYGEYYKKFWSRNLDDEHCLQLFRS
ncbi:hypothetical protein MUK42_30750 [Musa troglodytarum]|uniref:Non-haem dioxygenase N-terminal domain-containing protein n=1 Tax=Musa troglodytarum TaxID=320322 RepID=A0A9E7JUZ6_9LILI|nr:hypothetical protein MUK42_30750 [Musa troglodytarum]